MATVAVALSARSVQAESGGDPVRIVYEAPRGCPAEKEFLGRVRVRVPRMRTATAADRPRLFSVRVREAPQTFVGTLDITEPEGAEAHRRIPAETCEEAVDALALVTALAIGVCRGLLSSLALRRRFSPGCPIASSSEPNASMKYRGSHGALAWAWQSPGRDDSKPGVSDGN